MPTGYTIKLVMKGQSFKDFVMGCAHAFGAYIELKDESLDKDIPYGKKDDYHEKTLKEAKEEFQRLENMTSKECTDFGKEKKENSLKESQERLDEEKAQNSRLRDMRAKVSRWIPPSPDHKHMKEFMLQQLETSFNTLACSMDSVVESVDKSGWDYYRSALASAKWNVSYHQGKLLEENQRLEERDEWIKLLRESLENCYIDEHGDEK